MKEVLYEILQGLNDLPGFRFCFVLFLIILVLALLIVLFT